MASWTDSYRKWDNLEDSDHDTVEEEQIPHAPREAPATADDVFLRGPILDAVQRSRVFADGKAFVDMPLNVAPERALAAFRSVPSGDADALRGFVHAHFGAAGSDVLQAPRPEDWVASPPFLRRVDADYLELMTAIHGMWPKLLKVTAVECAERRTLVYRNHAFVVPGGRFREGYYWDSYWAVRGLLLSGMDATARGVARNFLDDVRKHGYVPNGNRTYYVGRSQPPLLAEMVYWVADDAMLAEAAPLVEKELSWWYERRASPIKGLQRYGSEINKPRPESYNEDVATAARFASEVRAVPSLEDLREALHGRTQAGAAIYGDLRAACESGWDFSGRWFAGGGLATVRTTQVVPVDLNAFLYNAERRLSAFYTRLGRSDDAMRFEARAAKRQEVMHATFWDATEKRWRDVLGDGTWASSGPCLSDYAPLWAGIQPPDGDIEGLLAGLEASGLLREHGVQCTCIQTGEQWDAPNAWPPLQDLLVDGLLRLKHESASLLARRVGTAWLASVRAGFEKSGACFEKYDAGRSSHRGAGGEYAPQDGFGWTNGAAMVMAGRFRCGAGAA